MMMSTTRWRMAINRLATCDLQRYFNIIAFIQLVGLIFSIIRINNGLATVSNQSKGRGNFSQRPLNLHPLKACEWSDKITDPVYAGPPKSTYPWVSSHKLPRTLTNGEYEQYINLLGATAIILSQANVTYVMGYGTLMGSYVMHDLVPWGDDAAIMIKTTDVLKVINVFKNESLRKRFNITGFYNPTDTFTKAALKSSTDGMNLANEWRKIKKTMQETSLAELSDLDYFLNFKICFVEGGKHIGKKSLKWPVIGVNYFLENDSHVWYLDSRAKLITFTRDSFYPVYYRPLGRLRLPAPYDTASVLRQEYGRFHCQTSRWNNRLEVGRRKSSAKCSSLRNVYPFVRRQMIDNNIIVERKMIGLKSYSTFCRKRGSFTSKTSSEPQWGF